MANSVVKAVPPVSRPCFTIAESDAGDWIARERRTGAERHFASRKAALHFVLFGLGTPAAALLAPCPAKRSH
jgi:hypothetical protein